MEKSDRTVNSETLAHDLSDKAPAFAKLHASGEFFVLPTVWDAWSAQLAESAGFKGLTIGSHPVANSVGKPDGERMAFGEYMDRVRQITASVDLPVSVDVDSGYGLAPRTLLQRVVEAGAVGLNIEDTVHRDGGRVRSRDEHADFIAGVREAADALGLPVVINGRTDAFKHGTKVFDDPLAEALARVQLMESAGARSVYPVAVSSASDMRALVDAVSVPVNATVNPVSGHALGCRAELEALGVRRGSFGPTWQMEIAKLAKGSWRDGSSRAGPGYLQGNGRVGVLNRYC
nr:isocitrate lyase/PEP mutase family protein [Corynebacterium lactis]